jgi:hypothetical protein
LERIPFATRTELAMENDTAVSPDDLKKSEPPST